MRRRSEERAGWWHRQSSDGQMLEERGRSRATVEEGRGRSLQERGGRCSEQAYLVQSGHKKQDENEDVKGRDHQQEE